MISLDPGSNETRPLIPKSELETTTVQTSGLPTLADLPKEMGVLLASVGVLGMILPGIAGAPALLAGGMVLWPRTFGKVENWFQGRFPQTHRTSMQQVGRFLEDLGQRYPQAPGGSDGRKSG